jgi:hypothetical protein
MRVQTILTPDRGAAAGAGKAGREAALSRREVISLLQNVNAALSDVTCPVLGIASAYPDEGAETIASAIAGASALDLSRPTLLIARERPAPEEGAVSGGAAVPTLLSVLKAQADPRTAITPTDHPLLHRAVLQDGGADGEGALLGQEAALAALLQDLRGRYAMIVVDIGAANHVSYALVLARMVSGVVYVIEAERTRRPVIDQALQSLEAAGARVIGAVLTNRRLYIPRWVYRWL